MAHYPVFLDLRGRRALVVGGGEVAFGKVEGLLRAGASVTVVAPKPGSGMLRLAELGRVRLRTRPYAAADMQGVEIVIAATDDRSLNRAVAEDAARERALANVVDDPELCRFIAPAVVERGDLQIAISTGGGSPALAVALKEKIAGWVGPEYAATLDLLRALRTRLREQGWSMDARRDTTRALVDEGLLDAVRAGDGAAVDDLLARVAGREFTVERLGVRLA